MADKDIRKLVEAIVDYLEWEQSIKPTDLHRPLTRDSFVLIEFLRFITRKDVAWEDMFAPHTLKEFSELSGYKHTSRALLPLPRFLSIKGRTGYAHRTDDGARVAKDLSRWHDDLEAAWSGIRFRGVETSASDGGWSFRATVSLGGVDANAIQVELYADGVGESPSVRVPMKPRPESGEEALVFECTIATSRPVSDFTPRVVEAMATTPAVCKHVHLPVQSGSSAVLRRMLRRYTREEYLAVVQQLREAIPGITFLTDIIFGFPGETDAQLGYNDQWKYHH